MLQKSIKLANVLIIILLISACSTESFNNFEEKTYNNLEQVLKDKKRN